MLKPAFLDSCRGALDALARETADGGPAVLMGLPWMQDGFCHNAYALLDGGRVVAVQFKVDLPNYGVFDEKRVFAPGPSPGPVAFRGVRIGVPICEDIWGPDPCRMHPDETGAEILLSPTDAPTARQDRPTARRRPARVVETACRSSISTRSAARTNWCSTAAPSSSTPTALAAPAGLSPRRGAQVWARDGGLALRRGPARDRRRGRRGRLRGLRAGPARLCRQEPFSRRRAGHVGRHRFPRSARRWRSTRWGRTRPRHHAALSLHLGEILDGRRGLREALGVRYDILPIAAPVEGVEAALAPLFAERRATSPRRTSRAARAASS